MASEQPQPLTAEEVGAMWARTYVTAGGNRWITPATADETGRLLATIKSERARAESYREALAEITLGRGIRRGDRVVGQFLMVNGSRLAPLPPSENTYLFSYRYAGKTWGFDIKAASPEEARERLRNIARAQYDGELRASVSVPQGIERMTSGLGRLIRLVMRLSRLCHGELR